MAPEELARAIELEHDLVGIGVVRRGRRAHRAQARGPDREQRRGIDGQPEDPALVELEELLGRVHPGNERDVARLVAALREVHREGGLRRPRDPRQDDVGLVERAEVGAVVVANGEFDGIDAIEVVVGESVQQARLMARLDLQTLCDPHDEGAEQIDGDDTPGIGFAQQRRDDVALDQTEDHQRARLLGLLDHAANVGDAARVAEDAQPPAMAELDHRRAHGGAAGIARAVGDDEDGHVVADVVARRGHVAIVAAALPAVSSKSGPGPVH